MKVYRWTDVRPSAAPRAVLQQGGCARGQCQQYAISISDGTIGLTIRFESEQEYRTFLERGEIARAPT